MAGVVVHAVTSLDGFIADPHDEVGPLFDWYFNGDVELLGGHGGWRFQVGAASYAHVDGFWRSCGAMVIGRRLFDLTNGWNGVPSVGDRVFVVTHEAPTDWVPSAELSAPDAPFTFVTTGVADAIAQAVEVAGDRTVAVAAGDVGGQAVRAGLVDEVAIDLVPVFLGSGKPYLGGAVGAEGPVLLEDPHVVVRGDRVLHLVHRVGSRHPAVTSAR
ncbi:MAG TPA: dihydrofolate reductase family protein [Marmoricola sp.]|nr:dihydrofolate reductase family protein [Marmoricola sp.]